MTDSQRGEAADRAAPAERGRVAPAAVPFGDADVDLARLRQRRSVKWRAYPADVLPLWVAEMDFPLAEPIAAALAEAVADSDTGYRWDGDLPGVLAQYLAIAQGWAPDPAAITAVGDVLVGVAAALTALTPDGSAVVVTPPVYPPFFSTVRDVARRGLVEVPLTGPGSRLDLDRLAAAFARPEVAAFLLCSPHNPTGTVHSAAELAEVARLADRHGVTVIADEVHAPLTLPGAQFTAYQSSAVGAGPLAVTVTSASKSWNVPGLKCAQLIAGSAQAQRALARRMPLETRFSAGHFGVLAATAAFQSGDPWLRRVVATIDRNRALLGRLLADRLPEARYAPPAATYLAWLDLRGLGLGDDPAAALLDRGRVALSSGPGFGTGGDGFARLNLATSPAVLADAVARMASVRA